MDNQQAKTYSCHHDDLSSSNEHHKMMIEDFKRRFGFSLILTIPVLLLSPMIQQLIGFELKFVGSFYILFFFSSVIYVYGGWPFIKGLYDELKAKSPGMMTLIGFAISVAYFYSSAIVFGLPGKFFFWELVTLIDIMLLGHWIEMKSVISASRSLELLVKLLPSEAHLVDGDKVRDVKLDTLKKDDLVLIKPGEKVPADGTVVEGESYLNESMLTGESKPAKKVCGDEVIGGAINGNGSLKVSIKNIGEDTYLSKVINLVQEAQKKKSKTQHLADKAAKWLTFVALSVGILTLSSWLIAGFDIVFSLERMVTVMVISCPHALGLAIPLVVAISTTLSAQNGLLIRNRTAFENSRKISTIIFDKTGTLTKGDFGVSKCVSLVDDYMQNDILQLAAALEQKSEHPIAQGIVKKSKELSLEVFSADDFKAITGKGVEAKVNGKNIKVVSLNYLKEKQVDIPDDDFLMDLFKPRSQSDSYVTAETIVFILVDDKLTGYISLADEIRPESYEAIERFKRNHIKVMMATGDNKSVANVVAKKLHLDGFYAEVLPHQKVEIIKELQEKGEYVAMTGDGINDAPALAQADIGIAVGSGTDIAAETADIILVNSNPQDILSLILFGKATYKKMIQNLIWATGYNVLAIPLAAGVLYPWGIVMSPAVGAVLMSFSTVIVAFNAQLLKNVNLAKKPKA